MMTLMVNLLLQITNLLQSVLSSADPITNIPVDPSVVGEWAALIERYGFVLIAAIVGWTFVIIGILLIVTGKLRSGKVIDRTDELNNNLQQAMFELNMKYTALMTKEKPSTENPNEGGT